MTKVYSYDRGQPWQEPSNPYNNSGGMDLFPNGNDFSTGIKVALAALYDEMADYFGWPSWSNPNPTPFILPQPVP